MKYAYIHKNVRELNFESLVVAGCHFFTVVACFMPWFAATPTYGQIFWYNSFKGPGFLIGIMIFLISLSIVILFLDRIIEINKIKLPVSANYVYLVAGMQQLFLIILLWSVLVAVGSSYSDHALRFGIFMAFALQVCGLAATYLNLQIEKKQAAKDFFQHPSATQSQPQTSTNDHVER